MTHDLVGSAVGTVVFALVLLLPGYATGWCTDLNEFRTRGIREQLAWSTALSFGVGTIAIVALVWLSSVHLTAVLLIVMGVCTAILFSRTKGRFDLTRGQLLGWSIFTLLWILIVLFSLNDLGITNNLWMSVTSYDHAVRAPFVGAVMRGGVPPSNPLYWPGHAAPMRYYYFWYVTCAVVADIAHISARQALVASCVWPLAGVAAMIALFARYFLGWRGARLTKGWTVAFLLMSVTGLDVIANVGARFAGAPMEGDMEWWSVDQVTSWADTFLWVPHHAAALVASLLCVLLLWRCTVEQRRTQRVVMACLAGCSFASAFGLSTYVAAGTAIVLASWLAWRLFHADRARAAVACVLAATVAIILLCPYILQLMHHEAGEAQTSAAVLGFGIRRIIDPNVLNDIAGFRSLRLHHPFVEINLAALVLLLPGAITELGFYFFVLTGATRLRRTWSESERCLLFFTWSSIAAVTFLRSRVLSSNDYGFRASLLMQFFLLLLGVLVLERTSGWRRRGLLCLAAIGLIGTAYQVVVLRGYLLWTQERGIAGRTDLAEQNYAFREAFAAIDQKADLNARVQYNDATEYFMASRMMQSTRQVINGDPTCVSAFGGEAAACPTIQRAVTALYTASTDATAATQLCQQLGAQYLIADRWDAVWSVHKSWVWELPAIFNDENIRVVKCSGSR